MFYGAVVWDPWLILSQIVCLQCLYYLTLGLFMFILVGTRVSGLSLIYFFDYSTLTASTVTGWCVIGSFMLSALSGAFYVFYLVERATKCLDFSATICIIHLFICIIYGGWPSSITWWVVSGTSLAVMALLGEWLCIQREMREIPIPYRSSGGQGEQHSIQPNHGCDSRPLNSSAADIGDGSNQKSRIGDRKVRGDGSKHYSNQKSRIQPLNEKSAGDRRVRR